MAISIETGIDRGDTKTVQATFKNAAGSVTDPTTITVYLRHPDKTETSYVYLTNGEVTKSSTGVFLFTYRVTKGGTYYGAFVGTGTLESAGRWQWDVLEDNHPFP